MSTRNVLNLVNGAMPKAPEPDDGSEAVRAQAAFVRALVDEVDRSHPGDRRVVALHEQLGDELALLARLVQQATLAQIPADTLPIDVLAVDDEEESLRAAAAVLRTLGYPCRVARDAEEALREFERKPAAIVLSDWSMPGMNGVDLCALLKKRDPAPYVILASAFHENAVLLDGVRGGADDFVRKPMDLDELEVRLVAATRLIRAVRQVAALTALFGGTPAR